MEKVGCGQGAPVLKKGKKKQAKDEVDRQKQAEKKKRRLEKALATSAAIRSELEKKKQKKKEEQQRLDEEGAAIAEAVALHVLLGEDTDESYHFMLNSKKRCDPCDCSRNIDRFRDYQSFAKYSFEGLGWATDLYGPGWRWSGCGIGHTLPHGVHVRDLDMPRYNETSKGAEISAGLLAAQAVSSLQIADDPLKNRFADQGAATVVINRMLGGSNVDKEVNLYREL